MTAHRTPASAMRRSHSCTCGASVVVCPLVLSVSAPPTEKATVLMAPATMPAAINTCSVMWVTVVLPSVPVIPATYK